LTFISCSLIAGLIFKRGVKKEAWESSREVNVKKE
jgi:hypothetical protein